MPSSEERTRKSIDQAFGYRRTYGPDGGLDTAGTQEATA